MFRCCSLETSHPRLLPQSLKDCSINLCLFFFCSAYRVIINIFLNSIYMCYYKWLTSFPMPLVKEVVFFPLYILASFVEDKVTIGSWIYLWALYSVPLIYISVFVSTFLMWLSQPRKESTFFSGLVGNIYWEFFLSPPFACFSLLSEKHTSPLHGL